MIRVALLCMCLIGCGSADAVKKEQLILKVDPRLMVAPKNLIPLENK